MADRNAVIHLVAGGAGGTVGAVVTCPLEVVKVRLQSSAGLSCNGNGSNPGPSTSKISEEIAQRTKTGFRRIIPAWNENCLRTMNPNNPSFAAKYSHIRKGTGKGKQLFERGEFTSGGENRKAVVLAKNCRSSSAYKELYNLHWRSLSTSSTHAETSGTLGVMVFRQLRLIVKNEGVFALWKGVIPNLIGVAPSKAVYFYSYSTSKRVLNQVMPPNTAWVHMWSAAGAGFLAATVVNPIWLIKTRLQLDRSPGVKAMSISDVVRKVYKADGFKGFYRGVTASYAGISETIIQFVIYEWLKVRFVPQALVGEKKEKFNFVSFMGCGSAGKLIATVLCYPHEVVRTRLREGSSKYRHFWQTLILVAREERRAGLYRGLGAHLLRTIPNTAISLTTYELVVYLLMRV